MSRDLVYDVWYVDASGARVYRRDGGMLFHDEARDGPIDRDSVLLGAAAPDLLRAVLHAEWSVRNGVQQSRCPVCQAMAPTHEGGCVLDAALTKAGFTTQEGRDIARRALGIR